MKIFSGESNKPLAEKIAKELKVKLSPLEIHIFPDDEKRIRILDKVVEEDVVVVQTTSPNPDKSYMELFFIADAVKRSGAKSVTTVIPYFGYQRQDHVFREGEAVSVEVIIKALEGAGVSKLITFDLHSVKIPSLFNIPVSHLSALPLFAKKIKENNWDDGKTVLVSPDRGGIRRIKLFSEMLTYISYAVIDKNRDLSTGKVSADKIDGKILQRAVIIDDMISSGQTIATAAKLLRENGAKEIFVFATHPVFSKESKRVLAKSLIKKVFVTDTIDVPKDKKFRKLEILSVSGLIAKEIKKTI